MVGNAHRSDPPGREDRDRESATEKTPPSVASAKEGKGEKVR